MPGARGQGLRPRFTKRETQRSRLQAWGSFVAGSEAIVLGSPTPLPSRLEAPEERWESGITKESSRLPRLKELSPFRLGGGGLGGGGLVRGTCRCGERGRVAERAAPGSLGGRLWEERCRWAGIGGSEVSFLVPPQPPPGGEPR